MIMAAKRIMQGGHSPKRGTVERAQKRKETAARTGKKRGRRELGGMSPSR
jgi:hypothetical protein